MKLISREAEATFLDVFFFAPHGKTFAFIPHSVTLGWTLKRTKTLFFAFSILRGKWKVKIENLTFPLLNNIRTDHRLLYDLLLIFYNFSLPFSSLSVTFALDGMFNCSLLDDSKKNSRKSSFFTPTASKITNKVFLSVFPQFFFRYCETSGKL